LETVRLIGGKAVMLALWPIANGVGSPMFAEMPPVDDTFIGLLVLSHGAYLAFKAMPKGGDRK
jgi:hypothetical protein